jgi:hypothetical protein
MRTIDADALKIALDTFATLVGFGGLYDRGQVMECIDAAPTVATDTNVLGKWISVDKRPPKQGRYLVWGLTQFIPDHNDEPNGYWQTKIAQWFEGIGWDCKVKFWQMLPEPPKEGEVG